VQKPKLPLNLNDNSQKPIMKIQKYSLTPGLMFLLPMIFKSFYYIIKIKKYLFIPVLFDNNK
jgi:hypothetical protein